MRCVTLDAAVVTNLGEYGARTRAPGATPGDRMAVRLVTADRAGRQLALERANCPRIGGGETA